MRRWLDRIVLALVIACVIARWAWRGDTLENIQPATLPYQSRYLAVDDFLLREGRGR